MNDLIQDLSNRIDETLVALDTLSEFPPCNEKTMAIKAYENRLYRLQVQYSQLTLQHPTNKE